MTHKKTAYVLYSGGLDSMLSIKLLQEQKIRVIAVHFTSTFFNNKDFCKEVAKEIGFKLIIKKLSKEYIRVVKNPKYGYGSAMNPCIDCHLHMIKKLKKIAGNNIIATGEVLNQRPFSQKLSDFKIIEREAKLENKILRPLSAKLLPETIYEKEGIVNRNKFLAIKGKIRKTQLELARKYKLKFLTPSGGCLLTDKEFARKLKDLFEYKKRVSKIDLELLKIGRHFRINKTKIIVGRNKKENLKLKKSGKFFFEVDGIGPTTILLGEKNKKSIELAAKLTLFYSDEKNVSVKYGKKLERRIKVDIPKKEEIEKYRI
ncbi:MAG: hypothetical protein B6U88_02020 [Candidatus Aenigmarchaeota archaeon ex4484_56]|nr:MAG: hypothetical protein B6U88_02020 [Candidatus Aenigmarchaeota archaeon ex4484_56]